MKSVIVLTYCNKLCPPYCGALFGKSCVLCLTNDEKMRDMHIENKHKKMRQL